ncbi:MAG TPA: hypothetical protein VME43_10340 [Bryobacteraceae bacterium]|nr:hypothetical protein [Bryobacteraceae bacterium]
MDFKEDIRQHVLRVLPRDPRTDQDLHSKNASDLLIIYANWLMRLIPSRPRVVHVSRALLANPLAVDPKYAPALAALQATIQAGHDLTPHLSTRIAYGYELSQGGIGHGLQGRRDLDLLLNDWGIHHLHLSSEIDTGGFFVKRDGPLLLGAFKLDDAYLIDTMRHGDWTREHVIQVIVTEWPEAGLVREVKGLAGYTVTEQERSKLRNTGVNSLVNISGRLYQPAVGIMASGVSFHSTLAADRVLDGVAWFESQLTSNPDFLSEKMAAVGATCPVDVDLHFEFFDFGYGIVERKTGFRFRLQR